jgi:hypothetical protein
MAHIIMFSTSDLHENSGDYMWMTPHRLLHTCAHLRTSGSDVQSILPWGANPLHFLEIRVQKSFFCRQRDTIPHPFFTPSEPGGSVALRSKPAIRLKPKYSLRLLNVMGMVCLKLQIDLTRGSCRPFVNEVSHFLVAVRTPPCLNCLAPFRGSMDGVYVRRRSWNDKHRRT